MAQPNTQDTQKVFNSATENFKSFVGSVENVSNTKHMEEIYANMTKLFDAFTKGALMGQGANSELLLRTVYRSLSEDFLQVVQDTQAVDKLIEVIKSKQDGIDLEKVDDAMVSETTKKVVTKTLDPDNCNPMQVVLDFIDELQTSILQVKINLSREYERRRIEYAKSLAGQQEDLDRLKAESSEQSAQISDILAKVSEDEVAWKEAHLNELTRLMEKFNQATGKASNNILAQTLSEDKTLSEMSKEQKKVNWDKLISEIKSKTPKREIEQLSTPGTEAEAAQEKKAKPQSQESPIEKLGEEKGIEEEQRNKEDNHEEKGGANKEAIGEGKTKPKEDESKEEGVKAKNEKEKPTPEKPPQPPKDELSPLIPSLTKIGTDTAKVGSLKVQQPKSPGTKLQTKPSKNGMHVCPICGQMHGIGQPHVQQSVDANKGAGGGINQGGVLTTIGKISQNIQRQLENKKFKNAFSMNYNGVQSGLQKQMKKVDKYEDNISKDLKKTEKGIKSIKRKSKTKGLLGMLFGGFTSILFTIIGGLILITLARLAMKKWKDTYMPKSEGSGMSIFGIPIPGWDTMKSIAIGIRNFIMVGIPNMFDRLSHFFGDLKQRLFGKKGIFKDGETTKFNLLRIIGAVITGHVKKAGGAVLGVLLKVFGTVLNIFLPGAGSALIFLAKFGPYLFTFITNQIMALWMGKKASAEKSAKNMAANQMATGKSQIAHFKGVLLTNAKGVKPFKGQMNAI